MGRKATITSVERIERQQRTAAIIQMRLQGCTLRAIGEAQTPPVSAVAIHKTIKKALEDMAREPFEEVRQLELARLDELLVGVYGRAISGDVACIDRALAISDRRVRLLGLNVVHGFGSDADLDPPAVRVEIVGSPDVERVRYLEERLRLGGETTHSLN
jgi:hypothetical protein